MKCGRIKKLAELLILLRRKLIERRSSGYASQILGAFLIGHNYPGKQAVFRTPLFLKAGGG
jgi:hypothetical protein